MYKKHTVFGDSHLVLAHVCSNHPFVTDRDQEMDESCNCRSLWPHQICNFCFWVRFLFNFRAAKLCVKKISENMQFFILSVDNMSAFFTTIVMLGGSKFPSISLASPTRSIYKLVDVFSAFMYLWIIVAMNVKNIAGVLL